MNPVVHFEIPASDMEKSGTFYKEVFGWDVNQWQGDYWLANTKNENEPGINGALIKRRDPNMPLVVNIEVKDIDACLASIASQGGEVVVDKMNIPGVGYSAYFKDPDGVIMGIYQSDSSVS